jgi:flagellar protein FlgJ
MNSPLSLPTTASLSSPGLAGDVRSLDSLRARAATDPRGAIRESAKAFESLFMQEVMKSMRAATLSTGMLDNEGTQLGTDLLDQQFATRMSGLPGGLSEMIARQLERQLGLTSPTAMTDRANPLPEPLASLRRAPAEPPGANGATGATGATAKPASAPGAPAASTGAPAAAPPVGPPQRAAAAFVEAHTESARAAEQATGIPAPFMISQAALETGWGRREIRHPDGSTSYNLFGIKAGANWRGPVAEVTTTEYIDGRAQKVTARFRAYSSYAESFADYGRLMKESPRYAPVLAQARTASGFAEGLQRAGYATDPAYAAKLSRVINTTLALQRSQS